MENVMLQFVTAKNELFCLPANTIKFVGKNKVGTRIYIENDIYYDVSNQYDSVLRALASNGFTLVDVPTIEE